YSNETGHYNTATGRLALCSNVSGESNTATGYYALRFTTSSDNTAHGYAALYFNTSGDRHVADGHHALYSNTTGYSNTAVGYGALSENTIGGNNTAIGYATASAIYNVNNTNCTFLGYGSDEVLDGINLTNSTALGNSSRITGNNQVRIGNSTIMSIGGYQNWTSISDERFKKEIKENVPGLEFINKLKPVTYHLDVTGISKFLHEAGSENPLLDREEEKDPGEKYIHEKEQIVYTGFIAQDVEAAAIESGYDFSGIDKPQNESSLYGLRYAEFVVPLVKAVQELSAENNAIRKTNEELMIRLEKLEQVTVINAASLQEQQTLQTVVVTTENNIPLLWQNAPNPFTGRTNIQYYVPENVSSSYIIISAQNGNVIFSFQTATGYGSVELNASVLPPGAYQYSLMVNGQVADTKQMLIGK
ncbi:MAG: tail fiber domain-containing protein, partial [Chitinophagales bacterium]|nr:tail fiber domain-containing protein [Chitinophagales bacterium]